ncbi:hypothetical protein INT43_004650 [Umbelopsis isabellina]|uniref:Flavodoxin-like domain-containing protein n=1 Tax=Mortierella isabellina TaxID=91625 RepID=A0A8H7PG10_MORIS|nr:hypothetical protein INT43_004650 [Umbelopsis isabellina]
MQKPNAYDTITIKPHEDTNSILQLLENVDINDLTYQDEESQDLVELGDEFSFKKEYQQAKFWWEKAAGKGSARAYLRLAYYYRSVEWDYNKSVENFKVAAKAGNVKAQCHVGDLCYASSNYKMAVEWFERAAEAGSRYAQQKLGDIYYKGIGVEKDLKVAAEWYYKHASKQGDKRIRRSNSIRSDQVIYKASKKITSLLIYIIFYSLSDQIYTLAKEVRQGLESQGVKVKMFQIPDTFSKNISSHMNARSKKDIPLVTVNDLKLADGIIWGVPIRFGSMPVQIKAFLDDTSRLWKSKSLAGKFTGMFFSNTNQHDGQETTAFTALANFYRHGMLYVPLILADSGLHDKLEALSGSIYGPRTIENDQNAHEPTREELKIARQHGETFAKVVKTYHWGAYYEKEISSLGAQENNSKVSGHNGRISDTERKVLLSALELGSSNFSFNFNM